MKITRNSRTVLLIVFPLLIGLYSICLGSDTNGDVWNYHWYNAWAFLHHRLGRDLEPAGAHSYFNPYLDVFSYLLITRLPVWLDAFVVGTIHGLVIWPIYGIIKIVFDKDDVSNNLSLLLAVLCLFNPLFLGEIGLSMHDNMIALFAISGLFILLSARDQSVRVQFLAVIAAGALQGAATGLKLTAAIYATTLLIVTFFLLGDRFCVRFKFCFLYCVAAALAFIAVTGSWDWNLYQLYGSPIFPFFNNIFHSPYAVTSATATRHMFFFREHGLEKLLYPFYFARNIHLVESTPSNYTMYMAALSYICFFAFIVLYVFNFRRKKIDRAKFSILIYAAVSYFVWLEVFGVSRYLLPTILLFPVLIFMSFDFLFYANKRKIQVTCNRQNILRFARLHRSWIIVLIIFVGAVDLKDGPATWGRGNLSTPYYSAEYVPAVKNANVLIIQGYPVGWIIPPINPKGHIIHAGPTLFHFETKKYFNIGRMWVDQDLANGNTPILIFDASRHNSVTTIQDDIARYGLTFMPSTCKPLLVKMGGHIDNIRYCQTARATPPAINGIDK